MTPNTPEAIPLLAALLAQPAERQRLIARYLRGDMDAGMLAAFEERLLEDPSLLDDVEAEGALRIGLRESPQLLTATTAASPRWRLPLSFAAGGLLGAVMGYALLSMPRAIPTAQRITVAQLPATRGDEIPAETELAVAAGTRQLVLRVPATNETGPFRLRVRDGGTLLGAFDDLQPDDGGQFDLIVTVPATGPTRLTLEMEAWRDGAWRQRPSRSLRLVRARQ